MPPKPDLLYNETAAVMIMKYFSLVTEKILVEAVDKALPFVLIWVSLTNLGDGVAVSLHAVCYSETVNGVTSCTVHFSWSFFFQ